jgi:hypothetical protein
VSPALASKRQWGQTSTHASDLLAALALYCLTRVFADLVLLCTRSKEANAWQSLVLQTGSSRAMVSVFIAQNIHIHHRIKDIVRKILATTPTSICCQVENVQIVTST